MASPIPCNQPAPTLASGTEIAIGLLQTSQIEALAQLLGAAFSQYEPLACAVGQTHDEIAAMVRSLGAKAVAEQLTFVALGPDGQMVAAVLTEDFACPPEQELGAVSPAFASIGTLLGALDEQYRAGKEIVPGQIAHVFMIGVAHHANGLGLAQALVRTTLANAATRGYQFAVTEATGAASQHVLGKLGFRPLHHRHYQSFVFDGKTPFAAITDVAAAALMECNLTAQK